MSGPPAPEPSGSGLPGGGPPRTGGRIQQRARRRRISGSTLFIVIGVLCYLALRYVPPDSSLADVRAAGALGVCFPPAFLPYIASSDDGAQGSDAALVQALARKLGVRVSWNLQAGWGQAPDPVDWGLRPESCDVVVGGIVRSADTEALMEVLPYRATRWELLRRGPLRQVAVLGNHWGLAGDEAFNWGDAHGLDYQSFNSAAEALPALKSGEEGAVLALHDEIAWLAPQLPGWTLSRPTDLPPHQLAIGVWKTRTTLKRALVQAIRAVQNGE